MDKTVIGSVVWTLCTSGTRQILTNGRLYSVTRGVVCVASPIITVFELSRSADYADVAIECEVSSVYPMARNFVGTIQSIVTSRNTCMLLSDHDQEIFLRRKNEIDEKTRLIEQATSAEDRALLERMRQLLTQETALELVYQVRGQKQVEPEPLKKGLDVVMKFLLSLQTGYTENRQVSHYASQAHLSQSHFTRLVKEVTGKTPSEWIATITVLNAQILLKNTSKSIKEVSNSLNFPEQFTFNKYFRQHTGVSPKEWRRTYRG